MTSERGESTVGTAAIVVVTWNGYDQSRRCLRSLRSLNYRGYRVCLLDNGSSDARMPSLVEEFPEVELLSLPENRGYAAGCNAGVSWARRQGVSYVWLLNDDTTVAPESLDALVAHATELDQPAVLSPMILPTDAPDTIWSAGGYFEWPWFKSHHIGMGEPLELHRRSRQVAWASGCSLFFHLTTFDQIGKFDERFFLYLEDVDWCLRARRKGIPIWYVPEAKVLHDISRSVRSLDPRILRYYSYRNYYLLVFRHSQLARAFFAVHLALSFVKLGLRSAFFLSYRRDRYYQARTQALIDFLHGRFGKAPFAARSNRTS